MRIDWNLPSFRAGFLGGLDKFIGPGATSAEKNLQLYIPFLAGALIAAYANHAELGWSWGQYLAAVLLTIDMLGGVITNATSSAKRWFHREGEGFEQHMTFIAIHFIQLTVFSWLFLDLNLMWVAVTGGYMMLACALVLKTELYLQRPVALTLYTLSLIISLYVVESPVGLEWFLPVFYLKLLISHILREEPYRPENEAV
ncbi:hypothetical protein AB6D04_14065 [Vibrio splendidus]|uniref:hypothetical protein n=1 Tax=Vibrio splendidus TaxID=29497 RepID=UPI000C817DAB|nr:hypothetical protein [Vibrio splendidus]PMN79782.1 hypothetical protein BCT24_19310 [Vibrio splendidus]